MDGNLLLPIELNSRTCCVKVETSNNVSVIVTTRSFLFPVKYTYKQWSTKGANRNNDDAAVLVISPLNKNKKNSIQL